MTFTIFISNKAKNQYSLLQSNLSNSSIQQINTGWNVTIHGMYTQSQRVSDVFRFILTIPPPRSVNGNLNPPISNITGTIIGGINNNYQDLNPSLSTNPKIVLILESPHKKEYQSGNPIAPTQGSTGTRIKNSVLSIIHAHGNLELPVGDYDLIICNPVQFQASLYAIHNTSLTNPAASQLRNKAWHAIYAQEKNNFFARLTSYSPTVIINACTAGLKNFVTDELCRWKHSSSSHTSIYYADTHASKWTAKTVLHLH